MVNIVSIAKEALLGYMLPSNYLKKIAFGICYIIKATRMLFNYLTKGYCNRKALATKVFPKYCEPTGRLLTRFAVGQTCKVFQTTAGLRARKCVLDSDF